MNRGGLILICAEATIPKLIADMDADVWRGKEFM